MLQFLLNQAYQCPPGYRLHCQGTHPETHYRFATSSDNSSHSNRTESFTENVTDFDFYIHITPPFSSQTSTPPLADSKMSTHDTDDAVPIHWSVADNEPVYRGRMVRQVESPTTRGPISLPEDGLPLIASDHLSHAATQCRRASRRERNDYSEWIKQRTRRGIPPWTSVPGLANGQWSQAAAMTATHSTKLAFSDLPSTSTSSKTLRHWADSYCSSPKLLKEFVYTKLLYGWDLTQLESAIRSAIALAPYHGNIQVSFTSINSKIHIRSSNRLSRTLSNKWLKFISIILFIYPFIWLFKQFHPRGGGKWEVCGSAYPLKRWIPSSPSSTATTTQDRDLPSYQDTVAGSSTLSPTISSSATAFTSITSLPSTSSPRPHWVPHPQTRIVQTPSGPYKLIGQREGEWFRHWEPVILRAVTTRYQSAVPLALHTELHGQRATPGSSLDGYHDFSDNAL